MSILQVVSALQVSNDSGDVRPVQAAIGAHGNGPARAVVASEPRTNHPAAVHIRDLALQVGDRLDPLQNHLLQLLSGAGRFCHPQIIRTQGAPRYAL